MERNVYEFISKQTGDPIVEWKTCKRCGDEFAITQKDLDMLDKVSPVLAGEKKLIPPPKLCTNCRLIKKLCFRNERKLYRRKCDITGKMMISVFAPESDFVAEDPKKRNEDGGVGEKWGQDPDFSRSMLDQLHEISKQVPKRIISNAITLENCEYSNYGISSKDCYLSAGMAYSEQCHYTYTPLKCLKDIDGYLSIGCQYTYECTECMLGYKLYYSCRSTACKDSAFLQDCVNCDHCFGCVNLVGKKYYFMNQEYSPEEYATKVTAIMGSHQAITNFKKAFTTFSLQFPKAATKQNKTEHCIGNNITNASECTNCFSVVNDIQECRHCVFCGEGGHNLSNCYQVGAGSQLLYECMGCTRGHKSAFCHQADPIDSYYAEQVMDLGGSSHLFLTSGVKHKHYMLLNKVYEAAERESLASRVIDKMQADGEWGEFLKPAYSPFPLNDTPAMEYFPVHKVIGDKESIFHKKGRGVVTLLEPEKFISKAILDFGGEEKIEILWRTKDIDVTAPQGIETILAKDLPDNIKDVEDNILEKAIICEVSGRPFKLIRQELEFYREHNIPLPHKHYETRYQERFSTLPPIQLFLKNCDKCSNECLSVYDAEYPGKVYCEPCYNKEIYG